MALPSLCWAGKISFPFRVTALLEQGARAGVGCHDPRLVSYNVRCPPNVSMNHAHHLPCTCPGCSPAAPTRVRRGGARLHCGAMALGPPATRRGALDVRTPVLGAGWVRRQV